MELYLLKTIKKAWDENDKLLIAAESSTQAIALASDYGGDSWLDHANIEYEIVGVPADNITEPGIVMESFNAA